MLGPLSDFISADQASALLVERFLGATVHAVLVRDHAVAEAVRAWHATANPGPLLLLPLDALRDALVGDERRRMRCRIASTRQARARAGFARCSVTRSAVDDGAAFIDARGAVWLPGSVGGPGPLRRRAELFALRAELTATEQARAGGDDGGRRASRGGAGIRAARSIDASAALEAAQVDARRAAEHQGELERRRQRAETRSRDADALTSDSSQRRDQLTEQARAARRRGARPLDESLIESRRSPVTRARDALDRRRARAGRRPRGAHDGAGRGGADQARVQVAHDRERRLAEEQQIGRARLESLRAELSDLSQADSALAEQMAGWQLDLETREATLADGEATPRRAPRTACTRADDSAHERRARARRRATPSRRATTTSCTTPSCATRSSAAAARRFASGSRPSGVVRSTTCSPRRSRSSSTTTTLRAEAESLRQELERLGPVNVLAIEEHEETVKRQDFLTGQRADLADAKQSLLQAIREIDSTARELFLATFTQVRENFRQIFMSLFGGGECDLRLENPDAPLDCDIEIHASPRGKRTQRIHLLSSGERALVALSLLFGIFLTKPSPFCLLDEVDAPLDDANVGRFVRMLTQFKSRTQFIVITHNPRTTTEAADAVYGVTMQEPGVSSLVSVRMRGAASVDEVLGR